MKIDFDLPQPLDVRDFNKIHSATVEILERTGMRFGSAAACEVFRTHGFKIDDDIVYFTEKDLLQALETVSARFTLLGRNPEHDLVMDENTVAVGMGGGAPFMIDAAGHRRMATRRDLVDIAKLAQSLPAIEFWRQLVIPNDLPPENAQLYMTRQQVKYLDKPYHTSNALYLELFCMAFGIGLDKLKQEAQRGRAYCMGTVNVLSPLMLPAAACDSLMRLASLGVPFNVAPMPAGGTTAPCTLPGILVQQNCEVLGPLVLAQLINPGCVVLYGTIGCHADLSTGCSVFGSPDTRLFEHAAARIARFYGLLSRGDVALTDAPNSDFQAGAEACFHFLNAMRSGGNYLTGCGLLGSFLGGSLAKVVLDAELAGYMQRYFRPLKFNRDTMAVDVIHQVGHRGQFMTTEHTFAHCRSEYYAPTVFSRLTYDGWETEGQGRDARQRAHSKALEIIAAYRRPDMDPAIDKDMDAYVQKHWQVKKGH